jgi:hypothetical protein
VLFHSVKTVEHHEVAGVASGALAGLQLSARRQTTTQKADVAPWKVVWATGLVVFFTLCTFLAHYLNFAAAETIFLNLTVAITSGAVGAFLGEHFAIKDVIAKTT